MRGKKDVRYIVSRLVDPDDLDGARETLGWYPFIELAKSHADRVGPGARVDAEGGTVYLGGPHGRSARWEVEWTNRDLYRGRKKRRPSPEPSPGT